MSRVTRAGVEDAFAIVLDVLDAEHDTAMRSPNPGSEPLLVKPRELAAKPC